MRRRAGPRPTNQRTRTAISAAGSSCQRHFVAVKDRSDGKEVWWQVSRSGVASTESSTPLRCILTIRLGPIGPGAISSHSPEAPKIAPVRMRHLVGRRSPWLVIAQWRRYETNFRSVSRQPVLLGCSVGDVQQTRLVVMTARKANARTLVLQASHHRNVVEALAACVALHPGQSAIRILGDTRPASRV
jgi:hypothetical protein